VCNSCYDLQLNGSQQWVRKDEKNPDLRSYFADLIDKDAPFNHDSSKLAQVLMNLYNERTGPLA